MNLKKLLGMIVVSGALLGAGCLTSESASAITEISLPKTILFVPTVSTKSGVCDRLYQIIKDNLQNGNFSAIATNCQAIIKENHNLLSEEDKEKLSKTSLKELLEAMQNVDQGTILSDDTIANYLDAYVEVEKQINSYWNSLWNVNKKNCEAMLIAALGLYYDQNLDAKLQERAKNFAIDVFEKYTDQLSDYSPQMFKIYRASFNAKFDNHKGNLSLITYFRYDMRTTDLKLRMEHEIMNIFRTLTTNPEQLAEDNYNKAVKAYNKIKLIDDLISKTIHKDGGFDAYGYGLIDYVYTMVLDAQIAMLEQGHSQSTNKADLDQQIKSIKATKNRCLQEISSKVEDLGKWAYHDGNKEINDVLAVLRPLF